jgi:hypothetical protein
VTMTLWPVKSNVRLGELLMRLLQWAPAETGAG